MASKKVVAFAVADVVALGTGLGIKAYRDAQWKAAYDCNGNAQDTVVEELQYYARNGRWETDKDSLDHAFGVHGFKTDEPLTISVEPDGRVRVTCLIHGSVEGAFGQPIMGMMPDGSTAGLIVERDGRLHAQGTP